MVPLKLSPQGGSGLPCVLDPNQHQRYAQIEPPNPTQRPCEISKLWTAWPHYLPLSMVDSTYPCTEDWKPNWQFCYIKHFLNTSNHKKFIGRLALFSLQMPLVDLNLSVDSTHSIFIFHRSDPSSPVPARFSISISMNRPRRVSEFPGVLSLPGWCYTSGPMAILENRNGHLLRSHHHEPHWSSCQSRSQSPTKTSTKSAKVHKSESQNFGRNM